MKVKNVFGSCLLAFGLLLAIIGFSKRGDAEVARDVNGTEVVYKNINSYNLNWRAFFGIAFAIVGLGIWILPSQAAIEATWERWPEEEGPHEAAHHHG
ncbi:MAG: hypothetical protein NW241_09555 [Bacteroidia bacterium]|nr:hypothetical protein [Bacteroidia bacterium]